MGTTWDIAARRFHAALQARSDSGAAISDTELAEIRAACPDLDPALLQKTTELLNQVDDTVLLSEADVLALAQSFPADAARLLDALKQPAIPWGRFRLFAPHPSAPHERLVDPDFAQFTQTLQTVYGVAVAADIPSALAAYADPIERTLLLAPKVQQVFRQLDAAFHFPSFVLKNLDVHYLEALAARPDAARHLKALQTLHAQLSQRYGQSVTVHAPSDLPALAEILAEPPLRAAIFAAPAVAVHRIVTQDLGYQPSLLQRTSWLGLADLRALLTLAKTPNVVNGLHTFIKEFGTQPLRRFVLSLNSLPDFLNRYHRPGGREVLAIELAQQQLHRGWSRADYDVLMRLSTQPHGLDAAKTLATSFPRVEIGAAHNRELLRGPQLRDFLHSAAAREWYEMIAITTDPGPIPLELFWTLAHQPQARTRLQDPAWVAQARVLVTTMYGEPTFPPERLLQALTLSDAAVAMLTSAPGTAMLQRLRRLDAIQTYDPLDRIATAVSSPGFDTTLTHLEATGLFGPGHPISLPRLEDIVALHTHPGFAAQLADPKVRERLVAVGQLCESLFARHLPELLAIDRSIDVVTALTHLREILGRPLTWEDLESSRKHLADPSLAQTLLTPAFVEFTHTLRTTTCRGATITANELPALVALYAERDRLVTPHFARVVETVRQGLGVPVIDAAMVPALLGMADQIDFDRIDVVMRSSPHSRSPNDLFLLHNIATDPALRARWGDRSALLHAAQQIYKARPLPRAKLDFRGGPYTERPPLTLLDSSALLRLTELQRSLQDPAIRTQLGQIIAADLKDTNSEHGGIVSWEQGRLRFTSIPSTAHHNGAYGNALDRFLHGGWMDFHLHATSTNDRPFSGPSGSPHSANGGDWTAARTSRRTDVVITTAGFVRGAQTILRVNVDLYFVDAEGRPVVIDLGMHEIPMPTAAADTDGPK